MIFITYVVLGLILTNYLVKSEGCGENSPFKYRIERFTKNFTQTTEHHVSNFISNDRKGYYIELQENLKYLCKGTLNITVESYHFWASESGIEVIQPGVFENQRITSQLRLSNNLIKIIKKGTFVNMEITDLDLYSNKIVNIEEGAFKNLPNLAVLYLFDNQIVQFHPGTIKNTPVMTHFSIGRNKLKNLEENSLDFMNTLRPVNMDFGNNELEEIHPNTFGNISGFGTISFSNNKLEILPSDFYNNNISRLELANNTLKTLPKEFFNMKNVIEIDLKGNIFDTSTIRNLKLYREMNRRTSVQFDE